MPLLQLGYSSASNKALAAASLSSRFARASSQARSTASADTPRPRDKDSTAGPEGHFRPLSHCQACHRSTPAALPIAGTVKAGLTPAASLHSIASLARTRSTVPRTRRRLLHDCGLVTTLVVLPVRSGRPYLPAWLGTLPPSPLTTRQLQPRSSAAQARTCELELARLTREARRQGRQARPRPTPNPHLPSGKGGGRATAGEFS